MNKREMKLKRRFIRKQQEKQAAHKLTIAVNDQLFKRRYNNIFIFPIFEELFKLKEEDDAAL